MKNLKKVKLTTNVRRNTHLAGTQHEYKRGQELDLYFETFIEIYNKKGDYIMTVDSDYPFGYNSWYYSKDECATKEFVAPVLDNIRLSSNEYEIIF
jgi:hypothetical protein